LSTDKAAAISEKTKTENTIFGKSTSDFLILLITAVTMLILNIVLSIAYYRSATAPDLRWLLAFLDIAVILAFYGAFGGRVKRVLLSMKLALTMLFVILIFAILGTLIPQGETVLDTDWPQNPLYSFYTHVGLFDMYYSRWFLALLYLLGFNISFCLFDRLPTTFRRALRPRTDVKDIFVRKCPNNAVFDGVGEEGMEVTRKILAGHHFHIHSGATGSVLAEKGRWSGLASIAFHLSFLLIAIGAIITAMLGFEGTLQIPDGKTISFSKENLRIPGGKSVPSQYADLRVTNHAFKIDSTPVKEGERITGYRTSLYSSDLELTQNGESLVSKTITVNDPLRFSSSNWLLTLITSSKINFHQNSYFRDEVFGYITVLQVTYKPGKSLIYVGFGLMMIGICALYFPHRRIWFKTGEAGELLIGGRSNRSRVSFQREFDRTVSEIRLTLGKQEAR
jgi:cytochrome c biogenesis protein ResB